MAEIKYVSDIIQEVIPYYKKKGGPDAEHKLVYDSSSEGLEPIYFFIFDLMNDFGLGPEKLVDSFVSSPGSGHFQELGTRATIMQQQGAKILGDVNTVLRSVLNIIYDLKEFRIRLQSYDDLNSKDKSRSEGAVLSLKQIWMDKVDITKGQSSIKAMTIGQAGFQTLINAFLIVKDEKDVDRLDLNDMVKRIVKHRIHEFNIWLDQSERELKKRYELEKTYLRSQVNSLKLYSRWAKPYLRAAQKLEMKSNNVDREGALVNAFNTILLELTLLGKSKIKIEDEALTGELPHDFKKMKMRKDYYSCLLVEFRFRGIPQRVGGGQQSHYAFGGKSEIKFKSYALNEDEIKKINFELEKSDLGDVLGLVEGTTSESLGQLQDEINFFLEEKDMEKSSGSGGKSSNDVNPFLALIGYYDRPEKQSEKKKPMNEKKDMPLMPDNWIESQHLRPLAASKAEETAFAIFDIYKKAHGMASFT